MNDALKYRLIGRKFQEFFLPTLSMALANNMALFVDSVLASRLLVIDRIASVPLTPAQYAAFSKAPLKDWDFLAPYADQSGFTKDGADCVIIEFEDHPSIALALEGITYGRYVGWLV